MIKEKKIWLIVFITFSLMVILTGCNGISKTANIIISITPNPVSYDPVDDNWPYDLTLGESNGVGVTLISLKLEKYDQEEELLYTQILYEEAIVEWFNSDYLSAFSSLQVKLYNTYKEIVYVLLTVMGLDDNGNSIEATYRVDFMTQY